MAILHGTLEGIDENISMDRPLKHSNTIVTAYYEFESKHGANHYKAWFQNLLRTSDAMIIFVEPGSKWYDWVKEQRTHAPTIIVPFAFEDLDMANTFTKEFWDFMHEIDAEAKIHKGSGVYKIWNQKLIFMYAAIKLNPFNTPGFLWMDAGYFRNSRDAPKPGHPVITVNTTEVGIPEEKLILMHVRDDPLDFSLNRVIFMLMSISILIAGWTNRIKTENKE
eukprot:CAMPEP_0197260546 /NCGR_PEP_ID=MMETSP1429-20130617/84088_1 /TAXON_ID=49237 /ORGANISM="Chaetoceros  sp., Strain UNC1202" /LENGTH=221 /DNA_ID=CAMNT_0042724789 /DNA_START=142 /DNA_END=807 /DNA_ORIENTATION=+